MHGSGFTTILMAAAIAVGGSPAAASEDLGFEVRGLVVLRLTFAPDTPPAETHSAYDRLKEALFVLPDVAAATPVQAIPFGPHLVPLLHVPGRGRLSPSDEQLPFLYPAGPDHFRVFDIPLLAGRAFDSRDALGVERVAIVNDSMAREFWPDASPLGQCLSVATDPRASAESLDRLPCRRIVGVVGDTRIRSTRPENDPTRLQYYIPLEQVDFFPKQQRLEIWGLVVRLASTAELEDLQEEILAATAATVPAALAAQVRRYSDLVQGASEGAPNAPQKRRRSGSEGL